MCTCNKEQLTREFLFLYLIHAARKSCQEKYCQTSRTQKQIKRVKDNLSRKTCSSYRRVSELVKKLVKENLLVCTELKSRQYHIIESDFATTVIIKH